MYVHQNNRVVPVLSWTAFFWYGNYQNSLMKLHKLARQYPDVNFILPHLGSFSDDWAAQLALIDPLARHPNIHTDSAGVRRFDLLLEAVRRAGPHKLLFGSDGPWLHPGLELEKIRLLGLSEADQRLVMGENFLRLTGQG